MTDSKQAQDIQNRLTGILEASPDFIATADLDGYVYYLNRGARRMLGYGDEEALPQLRIEQTHPQWAADLVMHEGIPTALRKGVWQGENAIMGPGGPRNPDLTGHRCAQG